MRKNFTDVGFAALAVVVAMLMTLAVAPNANAANGTFWSVTRCDVGFHQVTLDLQVSPMAGYAEQTVAIGVQSLDVRTGTWSPVAWSYRRVFAGTTYGAGYGGGSAVVASGKYRFWHVVYWWDDVQRRYVLSSGWAEDVYTKSLFNMTPVRADACYTG
jgi:hypothetical protein